MVGTQHFPDPGDLLWFPARRASSSSIFTLGLALMLSALTVHFRDIRDLLANLLTFWFFATPIIYLYGWRACQQVQVAVQPESVLPSVGVVPGDPVLPRSVQSGGRLELLLVMGAASCVLFLAWLLAVRPAA